MNVLKLSYFSRPGMELVAGTALLATFVIGGLWVFAGPSLFLSGTLSVGDFVVFMLLTQRLTGPMAQLSNIVALVRERPRIGQAHLRADGRARRIENAPNPVALDDVDGRMEYDDVTFGYEGEETVLDGADSAVESGETVALVGATGAGKSTVAKLLVRLYDVDGSEAPVRRSESRSDSDDVDDAAVRVDGHGVRDVRLSGLHESVGYTSRNTFLFDGTVAENVCYGRFDAPMEEIKAAEAHEFIRDLSEGMVMFNIFVRAMLLYERGQRLDAGGVAQSNRPVRGRSRLYWSQ